MKYLLFALIFIIFSSIGFSFFNKDKINLDGYSKDIYDYSINLISGITINLKSYEGFYKVFILWGAEKMNREAGSSLLKILEEPNHKTIFISNIYPFCRCLNRDILILKLIIQVTASITSFDS